MIDYTVEQLAKILSGKTEEKYNNVKITSVCTDTRKIVAGSLFFAIVGENFDGHDFAQKAIEEGGACVVAHKPININAPVIYVKDTLKAYGALATDYKSKFNIKTVAVTGSVGKTSTKEFVADLVSLSGKTLKNEGSFNNEIGLPAAMFDLDQTYKYCVCEMGMRGKGQIKYLCDIAKPDIGIISNIDLCHIELLGTKDNIADAKCEILDGLPEKGFGIVNGDSEYLPLMKERCHCNLLTYGENNTNDVYIKNINAMSKGFIYDLKTPWGDIKDIFIPSIAYHNVINSMPAVIVAKILGASDNAIKDKIKEFKNIEKRFNIIDCGEYIVIDDSYNANPLAVREALKTLKLFTGPRKIACLGEMYELGEKEAKYHREVGTFAKECGVDELVGIGPLAKEIIKGFGGKSYYFENSDLANDFMKDYIKQGDVVLVKGSHGVHTEKVVEGLIK